MQARSRVVVERDQKQQEPLELKEQAYRQLVAPLQELFTALELVQDLSFRSFYDIWMLKGLPLLFQRQLILERVEYKVTHSCVRALMTEVLVRLATVHVLESRVWCVYALYMLYTTQVAVPDDHCVVTQAAPDALVRIPLPEALWELLLKLRVRFYGLECKDAACVLQNLRDEDAFEVCLELPFLTQGRIAADISRTELLAMSEYGDRARLPIPLAERKAARATALLSLDAETVNERLLKASEASYWQALDQLHGEVSVRSSILPTIQRAMTQLRHTSQQLQQVVQQTSDADGRGPSVQAQLEREAEEEPEEDTVQNAETLLPWFPMPSSLLQYTEEDVTVQAPLAEAYRRAWAVAHGPDSPFPHRLDSHPHIGAEEEATRLLREYREEQKRQTVQGTDLHESQRLDVNEFLRVHTQGVSFSEPQHGLELATPVLTPLQTPTLPVPQLGEQSASPRSPRGKKRKKPLSSSW
jgi:hypothetical protein